MSAPLVRGVHVPLEPRPPFDHRALRWAMSGALAADLVVYGALWLLLRPLFQ